MRDFNDPVTVRLKMMGILSGMGLTGVDVTVDQSESSGITVIADIANTARIASYRMQQKIDSAFSLL